MYILIADSGSTKTDWLLLKGGKAVREVNTIGLNPYFQNKEELEKVIGADLRPQIAEFLPSLSTVHYYGTGCSTVENCKLIEDTLRISLSTEKINVNHDLLAAARALCNREWGIASILGTGSNSCLYNGREILENVPSTGYLWSDYGGGSQIGKHLIRDYFENKMPHDVKMHFEAAGYNREVILQNVYKKNLPGKYLASASLFAAKHIGHPFINAILEECFDSFFTQQVKKYSNSQNYKVHSVGSVGYFFKDIIAKVALRHGYKMGNVIKSPMEGLVRYHTEI